MKNTIFIIILALLFGCTWIGSAGAINLAPGDSYYVGKITPDVPASLAKETEYIKYLITLSIGAFDIAYDEQIFDRTNSILANLPGPGSGIKEDDKSDLDDAFSFAGGYILAKYASKQAGALVWYVTAAQASGNTFTLPQNFVLPGGKEKYGISHYSVYSTAVPEPSTLFLLGIGLIAVSAVPGIRVKKRVNKSSGPN
ncbi:MAG TPA: PEP-CTERM sorting domain-containing protein [Syntrophorhabdaceae bacterium]|nr:PEP-CTERM sorting domain-containing protein [Syntrophorhabdaceae bacterium]